MRAVCLCVRVCICVVRLSCCHLPVSSPYLSICRLFIPVPFSLHCIFFTLVILPPSLASFFPFLALIFSSSFVNLVIPLSTSLSVSLVPPLPPVPLSSSLSLYKGALIVMMVVGGRVHTGSFDKEMSKCVSPCVSVSVNVCRCLALEGQGADVMSVYLCV